LIAVIRLPIILLLLTIPLIIAADDAQPQAARSVHLRYPAPDASIFYNELTVERSTPGSYFMACGFAGGYFGIQELEDGRKIALYSVWDDDKQDDPNAVPDAQRVQVIKQNPKAKVQRFGGEGTGAQCLLDFDWKADKTYCFAVTMDGADISALIRAADERQWTPMATYRRRAGPKALTRLYSFIEDFRRDTRSAQEMRRARFGNGWVRLPSGQWQQLPKAQFTASGASFEAKETIDAGLQGDQFFLQTAGATTRHLDLGSSLERPGSKNEPPQVPQDRQSTGR
jgi:hypothetical protein